MDIRLPLAPTWVRLSSVVLVLGVIGYYSVMTTPSATVNRITIWDKYLHFFAYFVLTSTLAYATVQYRDRLLLRVLFVIGISVTIGGIIELVQGTLATRQFSWGDFAANILGAVLASGLVIADQAVTYVGPNVERKE